MQNLLLEKLDIYNQNNNYHNDPHNIGPSTWLSTMSNTLLVDQVMKKPYFTFEKVIHLMYSKFFSFFEPKFLSRFLPTGTLF